MFKKICCPRCRKHLKPINSNKIFYECKRCKMVYRVSSIMCPRCNRPLLYVNDMGYWCCTSCNYLLNKEVTE